MKQLQQIIFATLIAFGLLACGGGSTNTNTTPTDNNTSGTPTPTTITHNGTTYGFVTSPFTGKVWLDRNLGAAQACVNFDDEACFGDYYQWGRNFDGHQDSRSEDTNTSATDIDNVGNRNFILNPISPFDWAFIDKVGNERSNNWSKIDGTSICPVDFRVPTIEELKAETKDANGTPQVEVFRSFLKLSFSGGKSGTIGDLAGQGEIGYMWSSSIDGSETEALSFISDQVIFDSSRRANGFPVRCIKSNPKITIVHNGTGYGFVTSPFTGKVWLDRNLGAARTCESFDDGACFGDYYQWGRDFDGHQDSLSADRNISATTLPNVGHGDFIKGSIDWASLDFSGVGRRIFWSGIDGVAICPKGFRVPSISELKSELFGIASAEIDKDIPSTDKRINAFSTFLKLPSADLRLSSTGLVDKDVITYLWSSSLTNMGGASFLFIAAGFASQSVSNRATGIPVRCMQH